MKTLFFKSLFLFGVLICGTADAQQNEANAAFDSELHIAQQEVKVHLIVTRSDSHSKFSVLLRNEKGQAMYRSTLPKKELRHRFVFDFNEITIPSKCGAGMNLR
ncbi:MAG: hypothetical protein U0X91_08850 [Spirosomataceae bacterium]